MTPDLIQLCKDAVTADQIATARAEARIDDDHMADRLYWGAVDRKNRLCLALTQAGIDPKALAEVLFQ